VVLLGASLITFKWLLIPVRTEGVSMLPTYASGKINFVNRMAYVNGAPRRGDIVAIRLAGWSVVYIKRVIGLPGERVAVLEGQVYVDGEPLAEPYVFHHRDWNVEEETLGPREYFLMGDNRGESDFGRVDSSRILGRLVF
jgi:signal peptidase I